MEIEEQAMDGEDIRIPSFDGRELGGRWRPDPLARGVLVISHGLGEHGGCYDHVVTRLKATLRLSALTFDFRGHGRSPGLRGYVRRYEDLVEDLRAAVEWARRRAGDLPRFILGHSNGGQVAIRLAQGRPDALDGLILSNPSLGLRMTIPSWKRRLGQFLRLAAPWVTLPTDLDAGLCTRDPASQEQRRGDRLRHDRISAPLFFGMVDGGGRLTEEAPGFRTPALLLLGEADTVTDPAAALRWFERIASPVKDLRRYPGTPHEPFNDLVRDLAIEDVRSWLARRLAAGDGRRALAG